MLDLTAAMSPLTEPDAEYRMHVAGDLLECCHQLRAMIGVIEDEAERIAAEADDDLNDGDTETVDPYFHEVEASAHIHNFNCEQKKKK